MDKTQAEQQHLPIHERRPWQRWAARGWVVLAALLTLVYLLGVPVYLQQAQTICAPAAPCPYPQVSQADLAALSAAQASVAAYAWLRLLTPLLLFVACLASGGLIVASRTADGFAIFTAYVLLGFGFQFGDLSAALAQVSPIWAGVDRILSLAQVSLFLFFYLFPDGRFVPSWTKIATWVALAYTLYTTWQLGESEDRTVDLLRSIIFPALGEHPLYIIDRQPFDWSLTTWLGVYDLVYAMVLNWPTDLRRRWEMPVLERYHARLVEHGVQGYAWQRLVDDYRLYAPMGVYVAVEYCRGGVNERWISAWLTMLQRSLTACDDLDCRALWKGGA